MASGKRSSVERRVALFRGLGVPLLLFALALAVRLLPASFVILARRILFFGNDAYYHMRRILYTAEHFPAQLDFDPFINYPDGARAIWTPLFDFAIATVVVVLTGGQDDAGESALRRAEVIAASIPPLLGAATVVVTYFLGWRHFGWWVGVIAGVTLSLLPGHFWYSQIGYVDHHCAVALVTTGLLGSAMQFVSEASVAHQRHRVWGWAAALGGGMALSLLLWPGSLLHVAVLEGGLVVWLFGLSRAGTAIRAAAALALAHALAFAIVAPASLGSGWAQWSDFSPVVLSNFQPWFFASGALFALGSAGLWRAKPALFFYSTSPASPLPPSGARSMGPLWRRLGAGAGLGLGIGIASLLAWPPLLAGALESWSWLSKTDSFQSFVSESLPLLYEGDHFSTRVAAERLSWFFFAAPLALLGLGWAEWRGRARPMVFLFLWWAFCLLALTVLQQRFYNSSSVALALLLALSLSTLDGVLSSRLRLAWQRTSLRVVWAAAFTLMLWPSSWVYGPLVSDWLDDEPRVRLVGTRYEWFAAVETASWLRRNTRSPGDWFDLSKMPEYGVVSAWDLGHILQYVGRRPTSANNFGDDLGERNFALVQAYFASDETAGVEILKRLRARYVVVPAYHEFFSEEAGETSMYRALYSHDGTEFALAQHRLVYEYARGEGETGRAALKVFERVAGAWIVGRAAPGKEIRVRLAVETEGGRRIAYTARTRASETGRYRVRVPYASTAPGAAIRTNGLYRLECDGENKSGIGGGTDGGKGRESGLAQVEERAVVQGRAVVGPPLCLDPSP